VTTADVALGAGDFMILQQKIEGYNVADFLSGTASAKTVTLSFSHRHTKTGIHCVSLRNGALDRSYIFEYTQTVSDVEETHSETIALDTTGTWDTTTGVGLFVGFSAGTGSTFHGTADTWQAGQLFSTSNQVNDMDNASNFFRIGDVQLELGSTATTPEFEDYPTKLAKCQRYTEIISATGMSGLQLSSTIAVLTAVFKTRKRATPTVSLLDSTPQIYDNGGTTTGSGSTIAASSISVYGIRVNIDGFTGLTTADPCVGTGADLLLVEAEL
jgi:hypothetical protein